MPKRPFPLMRGLSRFARAKRGAVAIEFGFVAIPFMLLTMGVAELGMIGLAQSSLDFAVNETARDIRTGDAQQSGMGQADFKTMMCDEMKSFLVVDCTANLHIDVRRFDSFQQAAAIASPIANNQFQPGGFIYDPGAPSDIVVVRAYYSWSTLTPMFENVFSNVASGERIISSTMMFRNEPYE
jgi:Flp pilus assembly protein TadG